MSKTLEQLRREINAIDDQLLELLKKRALLMPKVLKEKTKNNQAPTILVPKREQMIIDRLIANNQSLLSDQDISTIFQAIITNCRNLQFKLLDKPKKIVISVQGIKGSFSEQAALAFCKKRGLSDHHAIDYAVSSWAVLQEIAKEEIHYGIVALNNSKGGLVLETIEALKKHRYRITDSIVIPIRHGLLTLPDHVGDIEYIYSHPQALKQCHDYLAKNYPHCQQIAHPDTALSSKDLADGKLKAKSAVIACKDCSQYYNLAILDENIQDLEDNETLFLVIQKEIIHDLSSSD